MVKILGVKIVGVWSDDCCGDVVSVNVVCVE